MSNQPLRRMTRHLVVVVVTVGLVSTSTLMLAGEAGAATRSHATHARAATIRGAERVKVERALRHACGRARRWRHHQKQLTTRFEKRLGRLQGWKVTAVAAGHTSRVDALNADIAHVTLLRKQALSSRAFGFEPRQGHAMSDACFSLARSLKGKHLATKADRRRAAEAAAARAKARAAVAKARAAHAKAVPAKVKTVPAKPKVVPTTPKTTPSTVPSTTPSTTQRTVPPTSTTAPPTSTTSTAPPATTTPTTTSTGV